MLILVIKVIYFPIPQAVVWLMTDDALSKKRYQTQKEEKAHLSLHPLSSIFYIFRLKMKAKQSLGCLCREKHTA